MLIGCLPVPDGYTLGWNSGGSNFTLGGVLGKSSLKTIFPLKRPPSQGVPFFPGIPYLWKQTVIEEKFRPYILLTPSA